jgi:hypothetical protein
MAQLVIPVEYQHGAAGVRGFCATVLQAESRIPPQETPEIPSKQMGMPCRNFSRQDFHPLFIGH